MEAQIHPYTLGEQVSAPYLAPFYEQNPREGQSIFSDEARELIGRANGLAVDVLPKRKGAENRERDTLSPSGERIRRRDDDFEDLESGRTVHIHNNTYIVQERPYWGSWGPVCYIPSSSYGRGDRREKNNNFLFGLIAVIVTVVGGYFIGNNLKKYTGYKEKLRTISVEDGEIIQSWQPIGIGIDLKTNLHFKKIETMCNKSRELMKAKASNAGWNLALSISATVSGIFMAIGAFYGIDPLISGGGLALLGTGLGIAIKWGYRNVENKEHILAWQIRRLFKELKPTRKQREQGRPKEAAPEPLVPEWNDWKQYRWVKWKA